MMGDRRSAILSPGQILIYENGIKKTFQFEAAHLFATSAEEPQMVAGLHGHSFSVEVVVGG